MGGWPTGRSPTLSKGLTVFKKPCKTGRLNLNDFQKKFGEVTSYELVGARLVEAATTGKHYIWFSDKLGEYVQTEIR